MRKVGQNDWGPDNAKIGLEVYRHEASNSLIYITDAGSLAQVSAK